MRAARRQRNLEDMQAYLEQITQLALASPWLLAVIMGMAVIDALLPVVPSEALIIGAGVSAAAGDQNLLVVIGAAALGSLIGEVIGYLIGRGVGPSVRARFFAAGPKAAAYERISALLGRRGGAVLIVGRFIPAGRTVATVTAGAMRYPFDKFLFFTALGTPLGAAWSAVLGYLGGATFAESPLLGLAFGMTLGTVAGIAIGAVQKVRMRKAAESAVTVDTAEAVDTEQAMVGVRA